MDTLNKLTEIFRQFPGIGPRQAKRFVYFLLAQNKSVLNDLTKLVSALQDEVVQCDSCFRFFQRKNSALCPVCADPNRNDAELMVVAKDTDLDAMQKSHAYEGYYFVLGGLLALTDTEPAATLRVQALVERISKESIAGTIHEIILALSANTEGDHTVEYLQNLLSPLVEQQHVKISLLGRGLSTGTELEYSDSETIKNALKNRQ